MFNSYKSEVIYNVKHQYLVSKGNYEEVVNDILEANQNLDEES